MRRSKLKSKLDQEFGSIKVENFDFTFIERYYVNNKEQNYFQQLSNQTCEDLDFDLFFAVIDRTSSKVGQQYFYSTLHSIEKNKSFEDQEEVIDHLKNNPEDRLKLQLLLNKLNSKNDYYIQDLFQGKHVEIPKWFGFVPFLSILAALSIVLSFFNPVYILILLGLFPIHLFVHYFNKRTVNIYIRSIPQLLVLNSVAKKLSKLSFLKKFSESRQASISIIDQIKNRISLFKLDQKVDSDLEMIYWFLIEMFKITFLLDPILLFSVVNKLKTRKKEIDDVFRFVGEVDTMLSIHGLRENLDFYCKPVISDDLTSIETKNMLHPLVVDCVPNSFSRTRNSFLLTGSNMAGKTTFIRAIGLNIIAGSTINTCFAESFSFPPVKIHSVIRIADDITTSSSYFFKEVVSVKEIIEESGHDHKNLFLLDELFKGTNTIERIALAKAILSYLNKENNFVFISTHDLELTELIQDEYDLFHFGEAIQGNEIIHDYKLKPGVAKTSNAINILKLNSYPKSITDEAEKLAALLLKDSLIDLKPQ